MRKIVLLIFGFTLVNCTFSQEELENTDCMSEYTEPYFRGGATAFNTYVRTIVIPDSLKALDIHGTLYVRFMINSDGSISDVAALNSLHPGIDSEVVRAMAAMPDWEPAVNLCKEKIRVRFTIPVEYNMLP